MTNKQAQELLIQNGQLVADTLRHLADNEIDSDYFAITSTSENGTEIEYELVITEYARQAAGTVDELVKALEAKDKRIAELEVDIKSANDRYENRVPTEWAYKQACTAIEKHRLRADTAEGHIAELVAAGILIRIEG